MIRAKFIPVKLNIKHCDYHISHNSGHGSYQFVRQILPWNCTVQKLTVWAQVFALEIWHMPFNPILHIDNSGTKKIPKAALASNWGQFVFSEKCPLNL